VADIAASAQEQATGLNEVNITVNQMDQVTQQNAAMVEQSTAASHGLAGEAHELARLVGQFKLGEVAAGPEADATPRKMQKRAAKPGFGGKVIALPRRATPQPPAIKNEEKF
jgi:methyl-accepting chemotaxis protein